MSWGGKSALCCRSTVRARERANDLFCPRPRTRPDGQPARTRSTHTRTRPGRASLCCRAYPLCSSLVAVERSVRWTSLSSLDRTDSSALSDRPRTHKLTLSTSSPAGYFRSTPCSSENRRTTRWTTSPDLGSRASARSGSPSAQARANAVSECTTLTSSTVRPHLFLLSASALLADTPVHSSVLDPSGKFVRLAPNHVSIADPSAIPVVLGHSTGFTKSEYVSFFCLVDC